MEKPREMGFTLGSGRTLTSVGATDTGDGLIVTVLGGHRPHVGAVSVAPGMPGMVFPGHRDGELSQPIAEGIHAGTGVGTVVVAGVHIDGITPGEISGILEMRPVIIRRVVDWYQQREVSADEHQESKDGGR